MIDSKVDILDDFEGLINVDDHESIQYWTQIKNTTAGTIVEGNTPIRIVQVEEKQLVIEVPKACCAPGQYLALEIQVSGPSMEVMELKATAKVLTVDSLVEESYETMQEPLDQIEVKLLQFSEELWTKLQAIVERRQDEIEQFLMAARGR